MGKKNNKEGCNFHRVCYMLYIISGNYNCFDLLKGEDLYKYNFYTFQLF